MADWAEQYNAKKAARLEEEKSKLNKNTGFSSSSNEKTIQKIDAKNNLKKRTVSLVFNSEGVSKENNVKETDNSSPQSELISCGNENDVKENLENSEVADSDMINFEAHTNRGKPPLPPHQLLQLSLPVPELDEPSSPPFIRPSRPSVPTPGKYGTLYGGAPSPGPNPSRCFQPPGFTPPTPPGIMLKSSKRVEKAEESSPKKKSESEQSLKSLVKSVKNDSMLSSSDWQEKYLMRKRARMDSS